MSLTSLDLMSMLTGFAGSQSSNISDPSATHTPRLRTNSITGYRPQTMGPDSAGGMPVQDLPHLLPRWSGQGFTELEWDLGR
jgi:hypothetical protein